MATLEVRRSRRLNTYDANGREYLANHIGWTRERLEGWITSSMRPHLQLWYHICVSGARRFNEAVDWINRGERGYFYNKNDLEEDLLLMCLCEGNGNHNEDTDNDISYAGNIAKTGSWTTQGLWARTAWRIVQENKSGGQAFEHRAEQHPAACYGFTIDLLCIASHSIAFPGRASIYEHLINAGESLSITKQAPEPQISHKDNAIGSIPSVESISSSTVDADHSSDNDYEEDNVPTPASTVRSNTAEKGKCNGEVDAQAVRKWMEEVSYMRIVENPLTVDHLALHLIDKNGEPITGDRRTREEVSARTNNMSDWSATTGLLHGTLGHEIYSKARKAVMICER